MTGPVSVATMGGVLYGEVDTSARRSLPWMLVGVAVLLTGWWGVDTFVLSDDLAGGGEAPGLIEHPVDVARETAAERGWDPKPLPEPVPAPEERVPVRLASSPSAGEEDPDAAPEVRTGRRMAGESRGASAEAAPLAPDGSGLLRPGSTVGPPGDDVIIGNTYSIAEGDEVWVDPGYAWVGTPAKQIDGLLKTRVENVPLGIRYEAPRHAVEMEGYWIERTEVSNRRYLTFLQEAARVEVDTPVGTARTPMEIVVALVGRRAPHGWDVETTARQLVAANEAAVYAAQPGLIVYDPETNLPDADATWARLRDARLPGGVRLRFYDRAPPAHWPDDRYAPGEVDHPARGLSLADSTALALWAGRHVPSELEWEYAARGTRGLDYPWGDKSLRFEKLVNGGKKREHGVGPVTVPVRSFLEGASWVGALNMLGNVVEWTSSPLLAYPESGLEDLDGFVLRGGSAADEDRLLVRPAFRGWAPLGEEDAAPPVWNQARPFAGVRLSRYEEPVRSRTVSMQTRYRARGLLPEAALETRVFAGVQGILQGRPLGARQDPAARPGVKSVVVQPLRYALVLSTAADGGHVPNRVTDEHDLLALSEQSLIAFGLLHVDLPILSVYSVEFTRRGKPKLHRGVCPPGTWLVALYDEILMLVDPDARTQVYALDRGRAGPATVGIHSRAPRRDRAPHLGATLNSPQQGARCQLSLELPLGNALRPDLVVRVRFDAQFEPSLVQAISDWELGAWEQ